MNGKFFKLTEGQQIAAFIVVLVMVLFGFWYFGIRDIHRRRIENERFRKQLAGSGFANVSRQSLEAAVENERQSRDRLAEEWQQVVSRLGTFTERKDSGESPVLRIDYKVELHKVRERLDKKAAELGISLSARDLGMSEEVLTADDPRTLMLQLRAVEKLADLTLDKRIRTLCKVHPEAPVKHFRKSDGRMMLEEFPVQVEVEIDFANFHDIFRAVFEQGTVFIFRNIRIVSGASKDAPLKVTAVMSALLFPEGDN